MIYILFIVLLSLFVLSYFFTGRDFFAPSTVQVLTFAGAVFMCIYFMWAMDCPHVFRLETIVLIGATMALSTVIGIIAHQTFSKIKIKSHALEDTNISPICNTVSYFVIAAVVVIIVWMLVEVRRIGGTAGDFFAAMHRFRTLNSYTTNEEYQLPWLLKQFTKLLDAFVIIYAFNLFRFFNVLSFWQKTSNLFIIASCCMGVLLTGARTPAVNLLLACFVMFYLLLVQKQGVPKLSSLKSICCVFFIILLIISFFIITKAFVGRAGKTHDSSPSVYISYYVGAGIIALDDYFRQPGQPNVVWGQYTFLTLVRFLKNYIGFDIPPFTGHLEFRPVGAGFATNVFTFLRIYHKDFGVIGLFTLSALSMIFLSTFYEYVKRNRGNKAILTFSLMYYSVVMSFFSERFYSTVVGISFLKVVVYVLLLYNFLIRKRIRLGSYLFTFDHMISLKSNRRIIAH